MPKTRTLVKVSASTVIQCAFKCLEHSRSKTEAHFACVCTCVLLGDSGGPILDNKLNQVGIVSWGVGKFLCYSNSWSRRTVSSLMYYLTLIGCAQAGYPGVSKVVLHAVKY
jgi:secreted trypsin-like serine protease